jgi:hypothetical protein
MSEENVDFVRRATDAYNRRDLDGFMQNWAPDAVVDWSSLAAPMPAYIGGTAKSGRSCSGSSRHGTKFGST